MRIAKVGGRVTQFVATGLIAVEAAGGGIDDPADRLPGLNDDRTARVKCGRC
jgi:hypothetical protein